MIYSRNRRTKLRIAVLLAVFLCSLYLIHNDEHIVSYAKEGNQWEEIIRDYNISKVKMVVEGENVECERTDEELQTKIRAFDVSDNYFAVAFYGNQLKVFDHNMNTIEAFKLKIMAPARSCGVLWNNKNIVLIPDYTDYATEVTLKGEFVCMYRIPKEAQQPLSEIAYNNIRENGDCRYAISSTDKSMPVQMSGSDGDYLIEENPDGSLAVLYDVSVQQRKKVSIIIFCVISFIAICIIGFWIQCRRRNDKSNGTWKFRG